MKTLTENQLALYLDCFAEFTYSGSPTALMTAEINYDRLRAYSKGGFKSIKPILRPLSDITEEEDADADDLYYSIADRDSKDFIKVTQANAAVTTYLLSCGFDLFNWIEQGLALDKTKMK